MILLPLNLHNTQLVVRITRWIRLWIVIVSVPCSHSQSMWAENGAERAENRLERSGERAKSGAQNPLHHKTTQSKKLKTKKKRFQNLPRSCQCEVITRPTLFVALRINLIIHLAKEHRLSLPLRHVIVKTPSERRTYGYMSARPCLRWRLTLMVLVC